MIFDRGKYVFFTFGPKIRTILGQLRGYNCIDPIVIYKYYYMVRACVHVQPATESRWVRMYKVIIII